MKLRIFTEPQQGADYRTLRAVALAAEDLGFDAFPMTHHVECVATLVSDRA